MYPTQVHVKQIQQNSREVTPNVEPRPGVHIHTPGPRTLGHPGPLNNWIREEGGPGVTFAPGVHLRPTPLRRTEAP